MSLKICVLIITVFLFQAGQSFRFGSSSNDKINEGTVKMIQDVFIKNGYPQAAIDKYISVVRQQYSQVPEEKKQANFESVVLLVEGALYRTRLNRWLSDNFRQYDVRNALNRIEEASDVDSEEAFTESVIEEARKDLAKEFPIEVAEMIANLFKKAVRAESLEEAKNVAIQLNILSMDGARVVTSRLTKMPTNAM